MRARAAEQRVVAMWLAATCFACGAPACGIAVARVGTPVRPLLSACARHLADHDGLGHEDGGRRLGDVQVCVLPPECAGELPRNWLRPYRRADVAKSAVRAVASVRRTVVRTAAAVPVGHSAYVGAGAIIVDADGVGILDGCASASRRPSGVHTVFVRRVAPERFEVCSNKANSGSRWRVAFLASANSAIRDDAIPQPTPPPDAWRRGVNDSPPAVDRTWP